MQLFKKPSSNQRQRLRSDHGAPRPAAFSYRAQRSDQTTNTGRLTQREMLKPAAQKLGHYWLQRFGQLILLIVLVVCTVNVLSLSAGPKIVVLPSAGQTAFLHNDSVYQQAAAKLFAASIWNHNKITVDTNGINHKLSAQFPELVATSITLPLLAHRPIVYLQPAEPTLIYHATNGNYVLDSRGKALFVVTGTANFDNLSLSTVTSQSGGTVQLGQQVLTGGDVSFIQAVLAELKARQITVSALTLPANSRELDVSISGQPYFVKFNLQSNDPVQQAGTFLAVQTNLQGQHITPAHYIDVRVDGRAYYQ
jgi:hypothetical protein